MRMSCDRRAERVAHVQRARDVRRRHDDRERRLGRGLVAVEVPARHPFRIPARFNLLRFVVLGSLRHRWRSYFSANGGSCQMPRLTFGFSAGGGPRTGGHRLRWRGGGRRRRGRPGRRGRGGLVGPAMRADRPRRLGGVRLWRGRGLLRDGRAAPGGAGSGTARGEGGGAAAGGGEAAAGGAGGIAAGDGGGNRRRWRGRRTAQHEDRHADRGDRGNPQSGVEPDLRPRGFRRRRHQLRPHALGGDRGGLLVLGRDAARLTDAPQLRGGVARRREARRRNHARTPARTTNRTRPAPSPTCDGTGTGRERISSTSVPSRLAFERPPPEQALETRSRPSPRCRSGNRRSSRPPSARGSCSAACPSARPCASRQSPTRRNRQSSTSRCRSRAPWPALPPRSQSGRCCQVSDRGERRRPRGRASEHDPV